VTLAPEPPDSRWPIGVEAVGGLGEMGHHHAVVDLGEDSFLLDFGARFPGADEPGVDFIAPSVLPAVRRHQAGRLRALLLTHGHRDHIGAVGELLRALPELPVYGLPWTLALLRAQLRREEEAPRGLRAPDLRAVSWDTPLELGATRVRWLRVTHSIPQASSVVLESPAGIVIHSGDFRVQREPLLGQASDADAFRTLGERGVDLALLDSTNAALPGRTAGERDVARHLHERLLGTPGLAALTCFSTHLERVLAARDVAEALGRRLCVYGAGLEAGVDDAVALGLLPLKDGERLSVEEAMELPRDRVLMVIAGSQGEFRSALRRVASGEDGRLRFRDGDRLLWSARTVPGNERAVADLVNRCIEQGAEVAAPWERGALLHCSGHAHREEIAEWLSWVRPRWVLPVHGEPWHLRRNRTVLGELGWGEERVLDLRSGQRLRLDPAAARVERSSAEGPSPAVLVLGRQRWEAGEAALKRRRDGGRTGVATVLLPWDARAGRRRGSVELITAGVFADAARAGAEAEISRALETWIDGRGKTDEEALRLELRRRIRERTGSKVQCVARISAASVVESDML
jgi:ribonuclease J